MAIAFTTTLKSLRASISPVVLGSVFILLLALVAVFGSISLAGTKTGLALSLLAVMGPIALYGALRAPLIFPFCLFVILVPFDNLLFMSSFGSLTKLIAIVSGAALVFWLLYRRRFIVPDRALLFWGLFVSWLVISLAWAIDPEFAYVHVGTILSLFMLYAAISFAPAGRGTLTAVLVSVCIGGALAGLYGAYLFHKGVDLEGGRLMISNGDRLLDPNQFAASLILPFSLALTGATQLRSWPLRIACCVVLLLIVTGFALCGSRGGLLGAIVAFAYLTWRGRNRITFAFVGLAGFAAVLSAYGNVLSRFSTAESTGGAGRTSIWAIGFAAFKASPLFGYGYANFPFAYDRYFLLVPEHYFTRWDRAPHDLVLETCVELGVVGLFFLGLALWNQFRELRPIGRGHWLYPLRVALEASYCGLAVASIFLDLLEFKYVWLLFILTALVRNAYYTQGVPVSERAIPAVLHAARQ